MKILPGYIQSLPFYDSTERGYLLGDDQENVFITKYEAPKNFAEGQDLEVFIFYNEDRELEATTVLPEIQVGQVGCFRVRGANDIGAFINIGTRRDILIPKREQLELLESERMALVILCHDTENRRLFATTRLNKMMKKEIPPYKRGDEVQLLIAEKIEVGRRVVIDGKYLGALFRQEMTDRVRLGEKVKGYVRKVEGKDIIVSMQREGMALLEDAKASLLSYLEMNGGYVRLNDDTDPEEIKMRLHMSKKTFKKAAGMLFKEGKVLLTKFGVKLNKSGEIPEDVSKLHKWIHDESDEEETETKRPFKKAQKEDNREKTFKKDSNREEKKPYSDREKRYDKSEQSDFSDKKKFSKKPSQKSSKSERSDNKNSDKPPRKTLTFKGK